MRQHEVDHQSGDCWTQTLFLSLCEFDPLKKWISTTSSHKLRKLEIQTLYDQNFHKRVHLLEQQLHLQQVCVLPSSKKKTEKREGKSL